MIALTPASGDDPDFDERISRLIAGAVAVHRPEVVWVHQIDTWFDHKWLGFSGKALGAIGVWARMLTIPPFVRNRIVGKWCYRYADVESDYVLLETEKEIHHQGGSAQNLQRRVRQVAPAAALFWFSGNTRATGRGSLMGYIPTDQEYWSWYLAFARDGEWAITHRKNIHDDEVRLFERSLAGVAGRLGTRSRE